MELELLAAIGISPGVVEGEPPLPEAWCEIGLLLNEGIEKSGRRGWFSSKEELHRPFKQLLR